MLNKDLLGQAIYDIEKQFNDVEITDMEAARLSFWKVLANEIINHFKTEGVVNVTVNTVGSASAQSGTGTGTIE